MTNPTQAGFKTNKQWSISDAKVVGSIKNPGVTDYKKTPGSLNAASAAAAFYAKRDGVDMVVIEGNSYGSRVYQIQELSKDIAAATVMRQETEIVIAKPDGTIYRAKATPVQVAPAEPEKTDDEIIRQYKEVNKLSSTNYDVFTKIAHGNGSAAFSTFRTNASNFRATEKAVDSLIERGMIVKNGSVYSVSDAFRAYANALIAGRFSDSGDLPGGKNAGKVPLSPLAKSKLAGEASALIEKLKSKSTAIERVKAASRLSEIINMLST